MLKLITWNFKKWAFFIIAVDLSNVFIEKHRIRVVSEKTEPSLCD